MFTKGHKINIGRKQTEESNQKRREKMTGFKHSEETKRKISLSHIGKGHSLTKEAKNKISISHMGNTWGFKKGHKLNCGEKNWCWKGDNVKYGALHLWVKKIKPKIELCECCNTKKSIDLANKGIYDRNINNWEWLCRSCHMKKDGRIKNLKQFSIRGLYPKQNP